MNVLIETPAVPWSFPMTNHEPPDNEPGNGTGHEEFGDPATFALTRKVFRWFAGLWYLVALFLLVSGILDLIRDAGAPGAFDFVFAVIGIIAAASVFWFAPDWFMNRYRRAIADAMNDPNKEIHVAGARTTADTFRRVEIVHKDPTKVQEPLIKEDPLGRVVFDSTQRPLRLLFGGVFFVVGLLIGLAIFFFSTDTGFFEIFFVTGWSVFCLASMGWVYEVTLTKHRGIADRKAGWFFIVRRQHYLLQDFDRVMVTSTFHRSRYDSTRQRYRSQTPRFKVDLAGNRRLNLRVFTDVADARRMATELSEYLGFPLEEESEVRI